MNSVVSSDVSNVGLMTASSVIRLASGDPERIRTRRARIDRVSGCGACFDMRDPEEGAEKVTKEARKNDGRICREDRQRIGEGEPNERA